MQFSPVTLHGRIVRLEPLGIKHVSELTTVGLDDRIWLYMLYGQMRSEADMRSWVESMLNLQDQGADLPFAVVRKLMLGE